MQKITTAYTSSIHITIVLTSSKYEVCEVDSLKRLLNALMQSVIDIEKKRVKLVLG